MGPSQSVPEQPHSTGSEQPGDALAGKPKVLFVMGAGHSGSTILGLTLGNCTDVFFAGEIARWLRYDGKPRLPGEERARFWSGIREQVEVDPALLGPPGRWLEQSSGAFRIGHRRAQRRLRASYRQATEDLYRAIARAAGTSYVVDTSHFPRRASHLQALEGIELYLLFVVRNPQSVVASYARENVPHKQTWKMPTTNAYLWLTYLLSVFVFLRHPRERRLFVSHEDFVVDPGGVIREILDCAGSDAELPDLDKLDPGLAFQGNRLLRTDVVSLKGRPERPSKGSRITALVHLPWRAIFARLGPATNVAGAELRPQPHPE